MPKSPNPDVNKARSLQEAINRLRKLKRQAQQDKALARANEIAREIQRVQTEIDRLFGFEE